MDNLIRELRAFAKERDWDKFHSPKNISMALGVEVSEITEIFQWLSQEQSRNLDQAKLDHLKEEIGDVMIYLAILADKFGIDPVQAAKEKVIKNKKKYPAEKVKGKNLKYTEYL